MTLRITGADAPVALAEHMEKTVKQSSMSGPPKSVLAGEAVARAPLDPIEALLCRLFAKFTGVAEVGLGDNFFELGGDSLSGMRLILELKGALGRPIELGILFSAPTVQQLAIAIFDEEKRPRWTSLVPLHTECAGIPIFTVHWIPRKLARHLGKKYQVYGLHFGLNQNVDFEQLEMPKTVEGIAIRYHEEIRSIQPSGPYRIIGYSFGGLVAYEVACQLVERGEEVELLCLVDTADPTAYIRPKMLPLKDQVYNVLRAWSSLAGIGLKKSLRKIIDICDKSWKTIRGEAITESFTSVGLVAELAKKYNLRPFHGRIDFFKALDSASPVRFAARPPIEAKWIDLALGGIEIHEIPGDHKDLIGDAVATVIAAKIDACLNRVLAPVDEPRAARPNLG